MTEQCDVAIAGGGPVGLLLGCLLAQRGIDVRIFEQHLTRLEHSRAVGVHPPGLACLARAGAAKQVLAHSVRVRRAFAFGDRGALGSIDFGTLNGPYPFVLTVPQHETERALEERLLSLSNRALQRGQRIVSCEASPHPSEGARITLASALPSRASTEAPTSGSSRVLHARFVVGCDGKQSAIRRALAIPFAGAPYREHFVMADTLDETALGEAAAVFLTRDGLVESFPLSGGIRRWVVGLGNRAHEPSAPLVEQLVLARTGERARASTASMASAFTAEHYLATRFAQGPVALAGDAAHVISPIGGQGMNLGWLDATELADALIQALATPNAASSLLARYAKERRRAAQKAMRRAELFMTIGQTRHLVALRNLTVRGLLSGALVGRAAQLFTMQGLERSA